MTTQKDLYKAILADPNNDELRLIYADWCEENGDPDRAEFIRIQLQLDSVLEFERGYAELTQRSDALLKKHRLAWTDDVVAELAEEGIDVHPRMCAYRRGFVTAIGGYSLPWWFKHFQAVRKVAPLSSLYIRQRDSFQDLDRNVIQAFTGNEHFSQLQYIRCDRNDGGDYLLNILAEASHLTHVRALVLKQCNISDTGMTALAKANHFKRLALLDLESNAVTDIGAEAFREEHFSQLRWLSLNSNQIGSAGVISIAKAQSMSRLGWLSLASNQRVGDEGFIALLESPHLHNLQILKCGGCGITDGGVEAFISIERPSFRSIELFSTEISDEGWRRFQEHRSQLAQSTGKDES